jgi:hypothetical protein
MIAPLIIISAVASRNNNDDLSRAPAKRFKNHATLTPNTSGFLGAVEDRHC